MQNVEIDIGVGYYYSKESYILKFNKYLLFYINKFRGKYESNNSRDR